MAADQQAQQRQARLLAEVTRPPQREGEMTDEEIDRQLKKTVKILNYILGNSFE